MTGYFHIENIKVETAAQIKHKKCDSLRKIASLQRMAGSQKIFQVHTPFKSGVQDAQEGKSVPEVHWGLMLACIILIQGILVCMDFQAKPFLRSRYISLLIESIIFQYHRREKGIR